MFWKSPLFHAILIVGISITAFLPILDAHFVNFDDDWLLTENQHVHQLTPEAVRHLFDPFVDRKPLGSEYLPIRDLCYLLEYQLWGEDPLGYHLISLLLHAWVALSVYVLARSLHLSPVASLLGASFFAVHPACSEVVCWISSRKDGLASLFGLGYLIQTRRGTKTGSIRTHLSSGALLILALLSKASAVVFPALALLLHLTTPPRTDPQATRSKHLWTPIVLALFFAFFAAWGHHTVYSLSDSLGAGIEDPSQRPGLLAPTAFHDLRVSLFPVALLAHYRAPELSAPTILISSTLLLLLLGVHLYFLRKSFPTSLHPALPGLWFLCSLSPVLAPTARASAFIADRYLYVPTIGIAMAFGYFASKVPSSNKSRLVTGTILLSLTCLSIQRTEVWRSSQDLWRDTLVKAPENPIAHFNQGTHAYQMWTQTHEPKQLELALSSLKRCQELAPDFVRCHYQIAVILFHEASATPNPKARSELILSTISSIDRAIAIQPEYVSALTLRASCAMQQNDPVLAEQLLRKALRLKSTSVEANAEMGNFLRHFKSNPQKAVQHYRKAARYTARPARFLRLVALSLEETGDVEEALKTLHQAHSLEPNNPRIQKGLKRLEQKMKN